MVDDKIQYVSFGRRLDVPLCIKVDRAGYMRASFHIFVVN